MTIDFTFGNLINFLGFVQGTLLGFLLILQWRKHISFPLLGLFLIGYSADLALDVFHDSKIYKDSEYLIFLPINFYLLFMPSLYLYTQSLTRKINWKKDSIHLLPAVIEFVVFTILFFQTNKKEISTSESWGIIEVLYILFSWIFITTYAIKIVLFVNKLKKRVENFYSNINGKLLKWVKWVAIYVVGFNVMMLVTADFSDEISNNWINPIINGINVIFIFWVALSGLRQTQISISNIEEMDTNSTEIDSPKNSKEKNIDNPDFEKLQEYMIAQKPFKKPQLHLAGLASEIHLPQRKLSNLINEKSGLNFNQFINKYRIEEAQQLLLNEKFAHLNMLGIAYEVGFNSKATFYATFKQFTGTTPTKFQKESLLAK